MAHARRSSLRVAVAVVSLWKVPDRTRSSPHHIDDTCYLNKCLKCAIINGAGLAIPAVRRLPSVLQALPIPRQNLHAKHSGPKNTLVWRHNTYNIDIEYCITAPVVLAASRLFSGRYRPSPLITAISGRSRNRRAPEGLLLATKRPLM